MKTLNTHPLLSALLVAGLLLSSSCVKEEKTSFGLGCEDIEIGPVGGNITVSLDSPEAWVAKTQNPWITVSPANGTGSTECTIMIDSSLTFSPREGLVRIELLSSSERKDIKVVQQGFEHEISARRTEVSLDSYAPFESRSFDVTVDANTPFSVSIPAEAQEWLKYEMSDLNLDRGARPRSVKVHFSWDLNFQQQARSTTVEFLPVESGVSPVGKTRLEVQQGAAETIEIGVKGDSLALLAISRTLKCMASFDTSERMEHWNGVKVWKSGPNKGRVRSATFMLFETKEGLPYQVQYLTAAEELVFFSNTNTFMKSLDPGVHICSLTNLKRLSISAYGLVSLPEEFKNLRNLEYLNLSGNNFMSLPAVISRDNFPNLHSLILNANKRSSYYDLSNTVETDLGGFIDESDTDTGGNRSFPIRFLEWEELDTLVFSVNYLQGSVPDLMDDERFPKWTAEEVNACDTLPSRLIGLPKVLPHTTLFTMNLNKLSGELPDWLLYHPCLDLWVPDALVFPQDGKDEKGNVCGFSNEPASLDYYYAEYVNKKYNPKNINKE